MPDQMSNGADTTLGGADTTLGNPTYANIPWISIRTIQSGSFLHNLKRTVRIDQPLGMPD